MSTLENNFDAIEKLIFEEGLRIEAIDLHPELDMMLVVLNTKVVLQYRVSSYPRLKNADSKALLQYELIGNGSGVHWPLLNEDLSLKGFLRDELKNIVRSGKDAAAA